MKEPFWEKVLYTFLDWSTKNDPIPDYVTMNTNIRVLIVDPGHGMSNRKPGVFDPGAVSGGYLESTIAMDWANELRGIVMARGVKVVRTRRDADDPCPVSRRDDIARDYKGDRMVSFHCNAYNSKASGTETFFRGENDRQIAQKLTDAVCKVLELPNRGPKTEGKSQHTSLAILEFDKCWLIEIGFIDNPIDRAKMLDPVLRKKACEAIADVILAA